MQKNTAKKGKNTQMLSMCIQIHVCSQKKKKTNTHMQGFTQTQIDAHMHEHKTHILNSTDVSTPSEAVGVQRRDYVFQESSCTLSEPVNSKPQCSSRSTVPSHLRGQTYAADMYGQH